jgi:protein-disulfide isomerase
MRMIFAGFSPKRLSFASKTLHLATAVLLCVAPAAHAQFGGLKPTQVHDSSALKPPAGHNVAIIEFYDLQCPLCAQTNPTLISAANQYKIPWVRYDLLIPGHNWSRQAAINARFFDSKSAKLGNDYRDYILANQRSIELPSHLQSFTQSFADAHKIALPFAVDPTGKLAAGIQSDIELGRRIGIERTPTIFIVASSGRAPRYTEVIDHNKLFQIIDAVLAESKQ